MSSRGRLLAELGKQIEAERNVLEMSERPICNEGQKIMHGSKSDTNLLIRNEFEIVQRCSSDDRQILSETNTNSLTHNALKIGEIGSSDNMNRILHGTESSSRSIPSPQIDINHEYVLHSMTPLVETTSLVERIPENIILFGGTENEQIPISPEPAYSSDHSEYIPDGSGDSSDKDSLDNNSLPLNETNRENILEGMEVFPETTVKSRKRVLKPHNWKRNVAKKKRACGEEYVSSRNKKVPAATMKLPCPASCRNKCSLKLEDSERLLIFRTYWDLANYTRQRDFIHSNTTKSGTLWKTRENSKRNVSISYFLPMNGKKIKVCKTMFINTLGIRKGVVDVAMNNRTSENTSQGDKRGKFTKKVTNPSIIGNIKSHIESFPSVPSHYCRSGTKRQYLCSSLNITIMYKLYCNLRDERNEEKASEAIYRKIFNENYNLGFHRPRKDQCRVCMHFHIASDTEKQLRHAEYTRHLETKELARTEKRKDKTKAEESNGEYISANFDLQQVLLVPSDPTNNALFYKRRLATYNFTIYNVVSKQGNCFMWSETQGKRGSCEMASCVYKYLKSLPITAKEVSFFSDRCGGQNLNKFMAGMFMTAVQEIDNLEAINLKFSVVGHSEMECDSMHSAIGREFKGVGKALWPADWETIARSARRKNDKAYEVQQLEMNDIKDYKKFVKENMCIRKKDETGSAVNWQKMCWMRFKKSQPFFMEFRETFDGAWRILNVNKKGRRRSQPATHLQALYQNAIPISEQKYQDLISLFSMNPPALNNSYKPFYYSLPHSGNIQDNVSGSEDEEAESS